VRVGIEHEVGDARRAAGVERLLQAGGVKTGANGIRADDGDGFAFVAGRRDEARGFAGGVNLNWIFCAHLIFRAKVYYSILRGRASASPLSPRLFQSEQLPFRNTMRVAEERRNRQFLRRARHGQ
jgi:hypothetical protein